MNAIKKIVCIFLLVNLFACASVKTSLEYKDLQTNIYTKEPLFLDIYPGDKVSFLLNDSTGLNVKSDLVKKVCNVLEQNGYVISRINESKFVIKAHIQLEKTDTSASNLYGDGGTSVGGAATGALIGASRGGAGALIGAGVGAVGGGIADLTVNSLVKLNKLDFKIKLNVEEKVDYVIEVASETNIAQGTATKEKIKYKEDIKSKKYQTEIVVVSKKANFDWVEERESILESISNGIANTI